jgi:hypothetical protein
MSEPTVISAARELLRAYYTCQPLPEFVERLAEAVANHQVGLQVPAAEPAIADCCNHDCNQGRNCPRRRQ